MDEQKLRLKRLAIGLGVFQILIGLSAIAGGYGFIGDPTGGSMGMPLDLLEETPFPDFLLPGIFLLSVNGIGHLIAGTLTFLKFRYAGEVAIFFGVVLALWIIIQVLWIGLTSFLQPLYFIIGLVEILLGSRLRKELNTQAAD
jgi:hypothetical protein